MPRSVTPDTQGPLEHIMTASATAKGNLDGGHFIRLHRFDPKCASDCQLYVPGEDSRMRLRNGSTASLEYMDPKKKENPSTPKTYQIHDIAHSSSASSIHSGSRRGSILSFTEPLEFNIVLKDDKGPYPPSTETLMPQVTDPTSLA